MRLLAWSFDNRFHHPLAVFTNISEHGIFELLHELSFGRIRINAKIPRMCYVFLFKNTSSVVPFARAWQTAPVLGKSSYNIFPFVRFLSRRAKVLILELTLFYICFPCHIYAPSDGTTRSLDWWCLAFSYDAGLFCWPRRDLPPVS